jgi:hypothetical protein
MCGGFRGERRGGDTERGVEKSKIFTLYLGERIIRPVKSSGWPLERMARSVFEPPTVPRSIDQVIPGSQRVATPELR